MKLIKICLIYFLIIEIFSQCDLYNSEYVCSSTSVNTYNNELGRRFQTPSSQQENYQSSYQGMHDLVGYPQLDYSADRKSCTVKIQLYENSRSAGTQKIFKFGDIEQTDNSITVTDANSYPDGLALSVKWLDNSNNEVSKLEFENVYFLWDNPTITQSTNYQNGQKGVIVELFGWPYQDVTEECVFIGIAGYLGVKVYAPHESILDYENVENNELNPWNYFYQPVSYKMNSRMGDKKVLKKMINLCRKNGVRVYTDVIINHMTKDGKDSYSNHKSSDCSQTWGPTGSSGGSPFWTVKGQYEINPISGEIPAYEFPAVPYFMEHFHCKKSETASLVDGWTNDYIDLNTGNSDVRERISYYFTELISLGFSGFCINFAKYVSFDDYSAIFGLLKAKLGGGDFPDDLIIYLELEIDSSTKTNLCTSFKSLINDLSANDKNKIKLWAYDYPLTFDHCDNQVSSEDNYIIGMEYREDQVNNARGLNSGWIYIRDHDITAHKNFIRNMLSTATNNIKVRTIFSSYSFTNEGGSGIPDGKSDCNNCTSNACKTNCLKSMLYQKAYNIDSRGYDTGDSSNWKEGSYTRIHRDIDTVNEVRKFMGLEALNSSELYETEKERSAQYENCEEKCSLCNENSRKKNVCIYCNEKAGYRPIIIDQYQALYECINPSKSTDGYYFNTTTNTYRPCYETCKTCSKEGNPFDHNCDSCDKDLIFRPEDLPSKNCVTNCSGYYYYNIINLPQGYTRWNNDIDAVNAHGIQYNYQYKCTANRQCLGDVPYHIKDKRKCIDDCKNDPDFPYRYNSYCLEDCPPNTIKDDVNYICKDPVTDDCILSNSELEDLSFGNNSGVEVYAHNYAGEYDYTDKHVSQYKNSKYTITFYKNSNCITGIQGIRLELELGYDYTFPEIDFGNCYDLVKDRYGIEEDLLVGIVENSELKNSYTTYAFFNPQTGEKLDAETICAGEKIRMYENISSLIHDSPNYDKMMKMLEQGINIFDPKDPFYTDICFPYDSPEKKDISLEDRLLIYFPNISLCDPGCDIKGIDLNNMTAICDCSFQGLSNNNEITNNALFEEATGDLFDKLAESNIYVFKCASYIFKYLNKSYGIYIYLVFLVIHIIMVIIFYLIYLDVVMKYIFNITQSYISFINSNQNINKEKPAPPRKKIKNDINKLEEAKTEKKEKKRKKNKLYNDLNIDINKKAENEDDKHNNSLIIFNKKNNINNINSKENIAPSVISDQSIGVEIKSKSKKKKDKNIIEKNKNQKNEKNKKVVNIFKSTDSNEMLETIQVENIKGPKNDGEIAINFDEYLADDPEEMEYDDAIKLDQRKYCEFFADNINGRLLFANTFCQEEPLRPMTIKIMVFILSIGLYFFINGFFFNEEYISKVYHLEEDKFFDFIPRSIKRFIYVLIIGEIIEYITGFFFVEENRIKGIFIREKNNILNLKNEIIETIKDIKSRTLGFIIVVFILLIFFIFYILCFNYVYHYSQIEWIKSSITIIIANQFLSLLLSFFETSFRFMAFYFESERMYQFSQIFN